MISRFFSQIVFYDQINEAEAEIVLNDDRNVIGECYDHDSNVNVQAPNKLFCVINVDIVELKADDRLMVRLTSQATIELPRTYLQLIRIGN